MLCRKLYLVPTKPVIYIINGIKKDYTFDFAFIQNIYLLIPDIGKSAPGLSILSYKDGKKFISHYVTFKEIDSGSFIYMTENEVCNKYNISYEEFANIKIEYHSEMSKLNIHDYIVKETKSMLDGLIK